MTKHKDGGIAGKALINQRERRRRKGRKELLEEEAPPPPMQSVTEESSLDAFLAQATLKGTEFAGERENIGLVKPAESLVVGIISKERIKTLSAEQEAYQSQLIVPRRPHWDEKTSPDELKQMEVEAFNEWREHLLELEKVSGLLLTPYEKNMELWRQLWRVLERSDVVVQILDARNPLLFRCRDLEKYVTEISERKKSVLLLNKSDLLSKEQRAYWAEYFEAEGVHAIFWSATSETDGICTPEQLIAELHALVGPEGGVVGMVGYPNVGKSSTINCLLGEKKVPVSRTPGKTTHFQTIRLDDLVTLCDCPGLVTPSFSFSREDMLLNGILPISQMREYRPSVRLLCSRVPSSVFEKLYGISLPKREKPDSETEDMTTSLLANHLLTSVAFVRGFMSSKGIPDQSRAARLILNDTVAGKLCFVTAPPGHSGDFHSTGTLADLLHTSHTNTADMALLELQKRNLVDRPLQDELDNAFFPEAHAKKAAGTKTASKKHFNSHKKEKLRRVYGYMDA